MKIVLFLALLVFASSSSGNAITKVYNSIEEFTVQHPDVKLIKLTAEDFEVDGTRSYSLGSRQTGRFLKE